jgi:hypothetical protein
LCFFGSAAPAASALPVGSSRADLPPPRSPPPPPPPRSPPAVMAGAAGVADARLRVVVQDGGRYAGEFALELPHGHGACARCCAAR